MLSLNPSRIHLSDIHIDTELDEHLNYSFGNLDFKKIIEILPKNISITIETNKKSKEKLGDFEEDIFYLKKIKI